MDKYRFYVYMWRNTTTGGVYIGKGQGKRAWAHIKESRKDHPKGHLPNAMAKHGLQSFELSFLEDGLTNEESKLRERYYVAKWNACHNPLHYNLTEGGEGLDGCGMADDVKNRIRQTLAGRTTTPQTKEKISRWNATTNTSHKITLAVKGKPKSQQHVHNKNNPTRRAELHSLLPQMAELRSSGLSYNNIASQFGVSGRWVYTHLRTYGTLTPQSDIIVDVQEASGCGD